MKKQKYVMYSRHGNYVQMIFIVTVLFSWNLNDNSDNSFPQNFVWKDSEAFPKGERNGTRRSMD